MKPKYLWAASALLYAVFFGWYTNLAGPLTEEEIAIFVQTLQAKDSAPGRIALIEGFMRSDTGDDFVMINLLDMNETPPDLPATGPDASADDLLDHYMEHMYRELFARASHPLFFGHAVADAVDIQGIEGADHWERAGLVRYRSRRDLLEIALDPRFDERHGYKLGALEKTIAYPVEPSLNPADPRLLLALFMTTVTALVHLILFRR